MFLLLRVVRGLCGYLSLSSLVSGAPTALLSLGTSGVSKGFQAELLVLSLILIIFLSGWLFFWLRGFINRLHAKKHGVPHPALADSKWAL
jgi:hypothetical protein